LLRRGFEPGRGPWTLPGGFVELRESVEDAARREVRDELEIDVRPDGLVGVYSRGDDRVVLLVSDGTALGEPHTTPEAPEVRAFTPAEVPWSELAFWSAEHAFRDALGVPASESSYER
jgi:8-oxo-dGTP diphosphatase